MQPSTCCLGHAGFDGGVKVHCFAFGLPDSSKLGGGFTKRILRSAMVDTMPEEVRTRRDKIGFTSPMPNWFNGSMRGWIWDQVSSSSFCESPIWDGPAIRDWVEPRYRSQSWTQPDCYRLWPFLQMHLWYESFFVAPPPLPLDGDQVPHVEVDHTLNG